MRGRHRPGNPREIAIPTETGPFAAGDGVESVVQ